MDNEAGEVMWEGFPKSHLVRIVMQLLLDMGYTETVETLERESNYRYKLPGMVQFEEAVLQNDMKTARTLLSQFTLPQEIRMACVFLLSQQSFATTLHRNDLDEAIRILSEDLSPAVFDEETQERVDLCSSLIVYPSPQRALVEHLGWDVDKSTSMLWSRIATLISPELCVPPRRMQQLLQQALELQEIYCPNHLDAPKKSVPSLYEDHSCPPSKTPAQCIARLYGHVDEVWDIALSPCGTYLLSGAKDGSLMLWQATPPFEQLRYWSEHRASISSVSWSPDSVFCLSADRDGIILLWMPGYASSVGRLEPCYGVQMCLGWLPSTRTFLVGGLEREVVLYYVDTTTTREKKKKKPASPPQQSDDNNSFNNENGSGEASDELDAAAHLSDDDDEEEDDDNYPFFYIREIKRAIVDCRVRNISINYNGTLAILSSPDRILRVFDLQNFVEKRPLPDNASITSLACSGIYNQVLVSISGKCPVMRLWDLDERRVIQTYRGHREDRYVLKCALGGPKECYVVSGSEDAQIYIWSKVFGTLLRVLREHTSTVNAVAWSITPGAHLFSAADDNHLAVWRLTDDKEEHSK
ncbi:WD G-beta repeat containing protein [Babesia ovis]|uniref:WD G-beta repeat containing protein n=1 Tax=Babesia ovis TaxID=5869 RepID=A0A9W5TAL0_BABOV|nr:WD G-beta repeat containing protein [Babesia ovis]